MANSGCDVLGVDLRSQDLAETQKAVEAIGRRFTPFACDISSHEAVLNLIPKISAESAGFDILVNNAGVMTSGRFLDHEFATWRQIIDVNLLGPMALTHAALTHLLTRKQSHIVNISSIAGKFGTEGVAAYAASKHGVVGLSSVLREELREHNIGVSWVCPSMTNTRMAEGVRCHFLTPLLEPQLVARAVRLAIEKNRSEVFRAEASSLQRFHLAEPRARLGSSYFQSHGCFPRVVDGEEGRGCWERVVERVERGRG